jgi:hypothetical protein
MNTKILIGALVGAIAAFLLGWVVYGMLMMPIYDAHEIHYEGLMKNPPNMIAIFVANLAWALALALIMSWSNMVGLMKGAVIGISIGFLLSLEHSMFSIALYNMFSDSMIVIISIVVDTIFSAVIGAIIGWTMGMGKPKPAV